MSAQSPAANASPVTAGAAADNSHGKSPAAATAAADVGYAALAASYLPSLLTSVFRRDDAASESGSTPRNAEATPTDPQRQVDGYPGPYQRVPDGRPRIVSQHIPPGALPLTSSATVLVRTSAAPPSAAASSAAAVAPIAGAASPAGSDDAASSSSSLSTMTATGTGGSDVAPSPGTAAAGSASTDVDATGAAGDDGGGVGGGGWSLYTSPLPQHLPAPVREAMAWTRLVSEGARRLDIDGIMRQLAAENAVLKTAVDRECADNAALATKLAHVTEMLVRAEARNAELEADMATLATEVDRLRAEREWEPLAQPQPLRVDTGAGAGAAGVAAAAGGVTTIVALGAGSAVAVAAASGVVVVTGAAAAGAAGAASGPGSPPRPHRSGAASPLTLATATAATTSPALSATETHVACTCTRRGGSGAVRRARSRRSHHHHHQHQHHGEAAGDQHPLPPASPPPQSSGSAAGAASAALFSPLPPAFIDSDVQEAYAYGRALAAAAAAASGRRTADDDAATGSLAGAAGSGINCTADATAAAAADALAAADGADYHPVPVSVASAASGSQATPRGFVVDAPPAHVGTSASARSRPLSPAAVHFATSPPAASSSSASASASAAPSRPHSARPSASAGSGSAPPAQPLAIAGPAAAISNGSSGGGAVSAIASGLGAVATPILSTASGLKQALFTRLSAASSSATSSVSAFAATAAAAAAAAMPSGAPPSPPLASQQGSGASGGLASSASSLSLDAAARVLSDGDSAASATDDTTSGACGCTCPACASGACGEDADTDAAGADSSASVAGGGAACGVCIALQQPKSLRDAVACVLHKLVDAAVVAVDEHPTDAQSAAPAACVDTDGVSASALPADAATGVTLPVPSGVRSLPWSLLADHTAALHALLSEAAASEDIGLRARAYHGGTLRLLGQGGRLSAASLQLLREWRSKGVPQQAVATDRTDHSSVDELPEDAYPLHCMQQQDDDAAPASGSGGHELPSAMSAASTSAAAAADADGTGTPISVADAAPSHAVPSASDAAAVSSAGATSVVDAPDAASTLAVHALERVEHDATPHHTGAAGPTAASKSTPAAAAARSASSRRSSSSAASLARMAAVPGLPRTLRPPRQRGLRILCLDGGGIRGLLMLECLAKLEADTGRRMHEMFDIICGTSTGGLIAVALCARKSLHDIAGAYEVIRTNLQGQSALFSELKRYATGASHSTVAAEGVLKTYFGRTHMMDLPPHPKCFVVCAAVDTAPVQPYLLRSYELQQEAFAASEFLGTSNVFAHEAVRATTSAPTYYAPATIAGQRMVDGAILQNNPSLIALAEAALLWPGRPIDVMVSLGTGTPTPRPNNPGGVMAWVKTVLDLAMSSDMTHKLAAALLKGHYYRFDTDGGADTPLEEMRLDALARMLELGRRYIAREDATFRRLTAALLAGTAADPDGEAAAAADGGAATDAAPATAAAAVDAAPSSAATSDAAAAPVAAAAQAISTVSSAAHGADIGSNSSD